MPQPMPKIIIVINNGCIEKIYSPNIADCLTIHRDTGEQTICLYKDALPLSAMDEKDISDLNEWLEGK